MGILFLVALLLAWPTFGLSIVAWLGLAWAKAARTGQRASARRSRVAAIEPMFQYEYDDFDGFVDMMDLPMVPGMTMSSEEQYTCGRLIMNYIAHHERECAVFIALFMATGRNHAGGGLSMASYTLLVEKTQERKLAHAICYRAVETLISSNRLPCFRSVDYGEVVAQLANMEMREILSGHNGKF